MPFCTCNIVHGSLVKLNSKGSWQWGIAQSGILQGQELVYGLKSWVGYEQRRKSF